LSSAILYVAIVAIWAGVLIPRWLRRDSPSGQQVSEETTITDAPAEEERPEPLRQRREPPRQREEPPRQREEPPRQREEPPRQREEPPRQREEPGRRREDDAPRVRRGARPVAVEARPKSGPGRAEDDWAEDDRDGAPRDHEHVRVLSARRRLLGLLVVLTIGSGTLAGMRLAAWWVIVPPSVMLLGYLALLRAAAKADAERREWVGARAATVTRVPAPVAPAAPPAVPPVPAPGAEIIKISMPQGPVGRRSTGQADEEFYDQYADAKLRAVGDLTRV
jgi:hypothetical protein